MCGTDTRSWQAEPAPCTHRGTTALSDPAAHAYMSPSRNAALHFLALPPAWPPPSPPPTPPSLPPPSPTARTQCMWPQGLDISSIFRDQCMDCFCFLFGFFPSDRDPFLPCPIALSGVLPLECTPDTRYSRIAWGGCEGKESGQTASSESLPDFRGAPGARKGCASYLGGGEQSFEREVGSRRNKNGGSMRRHKQAAHA